MSYIDEEITNGCGKFELLVDGYLDGEILPDEKTSLEAHLTSCESCRRYMNDTAKLLEKTAYLPKCVQLSPRDKEKMWSRIQGSIGSNVKTGSVVTSQMAASKKSLFARYRYSISAVSAIVILAAFVITISRFTGNKETNNTDKITTNIPVAAYWKVQNVKGNPDVDGQAIKTDSIGIGQWITTNDTSSAEIVVSAIGKFTVEPNSRVHLVKSVSGEHRIQVQYGTIDAEIDADPRTFFVDMPTVTAVDLGCAYKLTVDSAGDGLVFVKKGKVSLEAPGRESLVPAGKFCITKKDIGPGTPFTGDASPKLKKALMDFDFGNCAGSCVNTILKNAKKTDAVTLVSILPRVDADMKHMVYAKVAGFVPPPRAMYTDSVIRFNTEDLEKWIEKIQVEVQSKLEKSMEEMQSNLEKMNKDMDLNSKDWEEFGKNMEKFGEEFGKQFGKDFEKNFRYHRTPKADDGEDNESPDTVYFDKHQFKMDMEEMRKNMEEMKNQFDSEQFKREMEQSKEEMKRGKEEMKRANEELKNAMKEMKKNMKIEFEKDADSTGHRMKIKIYDKDNDGQEQEFEVPDINDVPDVPDVKDTPPTEKNAPEVPEQTPKSKDDK